MAKSTTYFCCGACGYETARWAGRCPGCSEWNSLHEQRLEPEPDGAGRPKRRVASLEPRPLIEAETLADDRITTGSAEFDRVLGGGLVPGSVVLIGGSPGIGKSTLLSAALGAIQASGVETLYVSGEESTAQARLRAERLGRDALTVPAIAETSLETVLATLEHVQPRVCVIDSVQTMHAEGLSGAPGTVGQVREVAARLERFARRRCCSVLLIGHVTKDGAIAGPRVLEHAVDCVLQFEGERERTYRTLRASKNRFGSATEVGVFEMREAGLTGVPDPSERFVRDASNAPGSCVLCSMEGSRPLLVEVQALVAPSEMVPPRRIASGIDRNRLSLVLAVLSRNGGPSLGNADVFVSVAGGLRVNEPGADLAVALAVASAAHGDALRHDGRPLACFGEIGLTGELRYVTHPERRTEEATRFGLGGAIVPAAGAGPGTRPAGSLRQALALAAGRPASPEAVAA